MAESLTPTLACTGVKVDVEVEVRTEEDEAGQEGSVTIGNKNSEA